MEHAISRFLIPFPFNRFPFFLSQLELQKFEGIPEKLGQADSEDRSLSPT